VFINETTSGTSRVYRNMYTVVDTSGLVSTSDEDYLKLKSLFRGPYDGNLANWNAGNIPTKWYLGATTNTNATQRWARFYAGVQSSHPKVQVSYSPSHDGLNYSAIVI
jgi:hypothetical protein